MNEYNIVDIASVIRNAMLEYIKDNPNNGNYGYETACAYGIKAGVRLGKGHYNPKTIEALVYMERSVFKEVTNDYSLPC